MAKQKTMTLEFIEQAITRETVILEGLRAQYKNISKDIMATLARVNKLEEQRVAIKGITLAEALEAYGAVGENIEGYKYLQNLQYKGRWAGTGLGSSGVFQNNNQHILRLSLNATWGDTELNKLAGLIDEVLPLVKTGALERGQLKLTSKGASVEVANLKLFDIFDRGLSEYASWYLGCSEAGEWIVFDERSCSYGGRARFTGTLIECLGEIRTYLYYEGGPDRSDDDDDDC